MGTGYSSVFVAVLRMSESVMSLRLNHHCPVDKLQAACAGPMIQGCMIHSIHSFKYNFQLSLAKKVAFLCLCENTCMLHRPFVSFRSAPSHRQFLFNAQHCIPKEQHINNPQLKISTTTFAFPISKPCGFH